MIDEKNLDKEIVSFCKGKIDSGYYKIDTVDACVEIRHIIEEQPRVGEWVPCSLMLPEELVPVNVTWVNRKPASYYEHIKDKPFTATAIHYKGEWYWWSAVCEDLLSETGHNVVDLVHPSIEIVAWQTLPEPYKESEE